MTGGFWKTREYCLRGSRNPNDVSRNNQRGTKPLEEPKKRQSGFDASSAVTSEKPQNILFTPTTDPCDDCRFNHP